MAMNNERLANSGLMVSRSCLETPGAESERGADEPAAPPMIGRFLDTGGILIDTADLCNAR